MQPSTLRAAFAGLTPYLLVVVWGICLPPSLGAASEPQQAWTNAVARAQPEQILALLDAGFDDVNHATAAGKTALMIAAREGDLPLTRRLLEEGASVHAKNHKGGTVLMYAAIGARQEIVQLFLAEGSDVNASARNGWTAIYLAAVKGYDDIVALLLINGADPNLPDVYGWTPLMRAVEHRRLRVVRRLLKSTAIDVSVRNQQGASAAHWAAGKGSKELVGLLAAAGADLSLLDRKGRSVADYADAGGYRQLANEIQNGDISTLPEKR